MAPSYLPKDTGLKEIVWVSPKNVNHGPRIKVYNLNKSKDFSVTIEDNPRVVAVNVLYLVRNLKELLNL